MNEITVDEILVALLSSLTEEIQSEFLDYSSSHPDVKFYHSVYNRLWDNVDIWGKFLPNAVARPPRFLISGYFFTEENGRTILQGRATPQELILNVRPCNKQQLQQHMPYPLSIGVREVVNAIVHELTHVDQFIRGDLTNNSWKGNSRKLILKAVAMKHGCIPDPATPFDFMINAKTLNSDVSCNVAYHELPWELEANTIAHEVTRRMIQAGALKGLVDPLDRCSWVHTPSH